MDSDTYRAMGDEARRDVLLAVLDGGSVDITSFVRSQFDPTDRGNQRRTLHHKHLPMLADGGYIEWDRSAATIRPGPRFSTIRPLLVGHRNGFARYRATDEVASEAPD